MDKEEIYNLEIKEKIKEILNKFILVN